MKKVITKIEIQKKNKDRVNIFIDGEYSFACDTELIYKFNLAPKKEIDEEKLGEIAREDNYLKGKSYALKVLEFGYKSEKEMTDKLLLKGYDEMSIARIMEFLYKYDFVNDSRYAKLYVSDKIEKVGKNKIKDSLIKKGISEELIKNYLSELPEDTERKVCMEVTRKKYSILLKRKEPYIKVKKKIFDYLLRNGYRYELSKEVISSIVSESDFEVFEDEIEEKSFEEMIKIGQKRYNLLLKKETDKYKLLKKLYDFLMRKGYSYENIKENIDRIIEEN